MPKPQHIFERYVTALSDSIKKQSDQFQRYVGPRTPFTTQLNQPDALAWWKEHINDDFGKQAMKGKSPMDMIKLQQKLRSMDDSDTG